MTMEWPGILLGSGGVTVGFLGDATVVDVSGYFVVEYLPIIQCWRVVSEDYSRQSEPDGDVSFAVLWRTSNHFDRISIPQVVV